MVTIVVVYDISDDKKRQQISNVLKDFGLERIGLSAFNGTISIKNLYKLYKKLKDLILKEPKKESDKIHIFSLCNSCIERTMLIGSANLAEDPDYYFF